MAKPNENENLSYMRDFNESMYEFFNGSELFLRNLDNMMRMNNEIFFKKHTQDLTQMRDRMNLDGKYYDSTSKVANAIIKKQKDLLSQTKDFNIKLNEGVSTIFGTLDKSIRDFQPKFMSMFGQTIREHVSDYEGMKEQNAMLSPFSVKTDEMYGGYVQVGENRRKLAAKESISSLYDSIVKDIADLQGESVSSVETEMNKIKNRIGKPLTTETLDEIVSTYNKQLKSQGRESLEISTSIKRSVSTEVTNIQKIVANIEKEAILGVGRYMESFASKTVSLLDKYALSKFNVAGKEISGRIGKTVRDAMDNISVNMEQLIQKYYEYDVSGMIGTEDSRIAFYKGTSNKYQKGYGELQIMMDETYRKMNQSMGVSVVRAEELRDVTASVLQYTIPLGVSYDDIAKMQTEYSRTLETNRIMSQENIINIAEMAKGTTLGIENATKLAANFEKYGISVSNTSDVIDELLKMSGESFINLDKATDDITANMGLVNKMGFKDGVRGMAEMVKLSQQFKINIETVGELSKTFNSLEGSFEKVANLQLLGAENTDPFQLMYEARNDVPKFMRSIGEMTEGMLKFDRMKGDFVSDAFSRDIMEEYAKSLNMQYDELYSIAVQNEKINLIKKQNVFLSDKELENAAQLVEYDKERQRFGLRVKTATGTEFKDIANLTREDINYYGGQMTKERTMRQSAYDVQGAKSMQEYMANALELDVSTYLQQFSSSLENVKKAQKEMMEEAGRDGIVTVQEYTKINERIFADFNSNMNNYVKDLNENATLFKRFIGQEELVTRIIPNMIKTNSDALVGTLEQVTSKILENSEAGQTAYLVEVKKAFAEMQKEFTDNLRNVIKDSKSVKQYDGSPFRNRALDGFNGN